MNFSDMARKRKQIGPSLVGFHKFLRDKGYGAQSLEAEKRYELYQEYVKSEKE